MNISWVSQPATANLKVLNKYEIPHIKIFSEDMEYFHSILFVT